MKFLKQLLLYVGLLSTGNFVFAQFSANSVYMDFRNQKISDIIYAVADVCGQSVLIDETVTESVTFRFEDKDFDSALNRFCDYCHLYSEKDNGVYKISKVKISIDAEKKITLNTENVQTEPFLNMLSRVTNTTIMYDSLPKNAVTIRVKDASLEDILNLCIVKLPGFGLERIASGYYITKSAGANARRNVDVFTVSEANGLYSVNIQRASLQNVLEALFKKAKKECSILSKTAVQLEGVKFTDKNFEELLTLILFQSNCDFTTADGIYYIFEVQKKDIIKNFKQSKLITLKNINVENLTSLLPSGLESGSFLKIDKNTNSVILNGSMAEIKALEDFIFKIDVPVTDSYYKRFDCKNITAKEAIALLPKTLLKAETVEIPDSSSFITLVTKETETKIAAFLSEVDIKNVNKEVVLKYIKSEELLQKLPPSVNKENIIESSNPNLVFFKGNETLYENFTNELSKIDKPKQQIRYELLVIQRQKTKSLNFGSSFTANSTSETPGFAWAGSLTNIFNINFDIISQFGVQFAGSLNAEIGEGKSHVLADTTLNGISGEAISFSNTNTYRYRDIVENSSGEKYTSTTREIASGLVLNVNGWVSGEDMITVKVDAQVSKQGKADTSSKDTTNPPSTSEKKVSTNVRTKSGEPVVIGGLFQSETDLSEKRVPWLGSVPLLGNLFKKKTESLADSEFVIYLVPFVEKNETEILSEKENLFRLMEKYEL